MQNSKQLISLLVWKASTLSVHNGYFLDRWMHACMDERMDKAMDRCLTIIHVSYGFGRNGSSSGEIHCDVMIKCTVLGIRPLRFNPASTTYYLCDLE